MTIGKPVLRRAQAQKDVTIAIAYYLEQDVPGAAEDFITALEKAVGHIGRHPTSGSPRYASELGLPELRCWQIKRFPYLLFYIECDEHIDVWRILHAERDIPVRLREVD